MKMTCTATLDNQQSRDELVKRLENIGFKPNVNRDLVTVVYEGYSKVKVEVLTAIFEEYRRHEITFGHCQCDGKKCKECTCDRR